MGSDVTVGPVSGEAEAGAGGASASASADADGGGPAPEVGADVGAGTASGSDGGENGTESSSGNATEPAANTQTPPANVTMNGPPSEPPPVSEAPPQLPNLVIEGVRWDPSAPAAGDRVVFTVRIANTGGAAAGAFRVWAAVAGGSLAGAGVDALAQGEASDVPVGEWLATAGTHAVLAEADALSSVAESREDDNAAGAAISVGALAAPSGLGTGPSIGSPDGSPAAAAPGADGSAVDAGPDPSAEEGLWLPLTFVGVASAAPLVAWTWHRRRARTRAARRAR